MTIIRFSTRMIEYPHTVPIRDEDLDFGDDNGFSNGAMLSDHGMAQDMAIGVVQEGNILSVLTNRQRQVISLLSEGRSRKETAETRGVSLQSVHQIVLRIRKRVKDKNAI